MRRQRRLAGSHLQAGQRDGTSVWRGAAGNEKIQPRGKVVRFLGGSPQSRGPRVRVIAPEKEVMIGGASLHSMEGFGGGEFVELSTARGGQASAEDRIAVNQCSRSQCHVRLGREGGLVAAARRRTSAISELPFARKRVSSAGTFRCSSHKCWEVLVGAHTGSTCMRVPLSF